MRKTDALMQLWKRYPYRHHSSCLSLPISIMCLSKSVDHCTDAISLSSNALPLTDTLSLSVSLLVSSLFLLFCHTKTHGNLFHWSLIAIKSSDKHHCFTQRADHNIMTLSIMTLSIMTLSVMSLNIMILSITRHKWQQKGSCCSSTVKWEKIYTRKINYKCILHA